MRGGTGKGKVQAIMRQQSVHQVRHSLSSPLAKSCTHPPPAHLHPAAPAHLHNDMMPLYSPVSGFRAFDTGGDAMAGDGGAGEHGLGEAGSRIGAFGM